MCVCVCVLQPTGSEVVIVSPCILRSRTHHAPVSVRLKQKHTQACTRTRTHTQTRSPTNHSLLSPLKQRSVWKSAGTTCHINLNIFNRNNTSKCVFFLILCECVCVFVCVPNGLCSFLYRPRVNKCGFMIREKKTQRRRGSLSGF